MIKLLDWDTEFFGRKIGRILSNRLDSAAADAVLEEARLHGMECLYFDADPNDPDTLAAAQGHGFRLVDVRLMLEHPFLDRPAPALRYPIDAGLVIDAPRPEDLVRSRAIGVQIGRTSRFAFDPNFGQEACDRLYRLWVENSLEGYADIVMAARWSPEGEAVGLITCRVRGAVADIQLAGILAEHRRRGVGTGLVQAALDWARAQKAERMEVVTQGRNIAAQRLYQQMGFFTRAMTLTFHKWLGE